ncbi:MAG: putative bifunctional diguanylate cyclase/phosphodiesterase, partial [Burkholderiaceae bacterium]
AEIASSRLLYDDMPIVQTVVRDITQRKLTEELQGAQNRILNMVATGMPLADILVALAHFVEHRSGAGLCALSMLGVSGAAFESTVAPSLPPAFSAMFDGMRIGPFRTSAGTAAFRVEPVAVADVRTDPLWRHYRGLAREHGVRASLSLPIVGRNRKALGALTLFFPEAGAPDSRDIQIADIAANLAGIAIESRRADERVRTLAHYDELTGLPNRFLFKELLDAALARTHRDGERFAVMFLDLDRFKNINDTFGHDAGDAALHEIAVRLKKSLRESDVIARMGGDEFYILLDRLGDARDAAMIAQKVLDEAAHPFQVGTQECRLTASVGIVMAPDDGDDAQTLLKNSDIAMYRAKNQGKNAFQFYSANQNIHTIERLALESRFRHALDNREFVLHYQPKISLPDGRITGVEALVRWQHPERGLLAPGAFIGLAEETGLIVPLGKHVMRLAHAASMTLQAQFGQPIRIAVNLSARQLDDPHFLDDVRQLLGGIEPSHVLLDMEITESMVMHNPDHAVEMVRALEAMGIRLSIDDFGTGYSSLAYLKRFPVDSLKIDRSFVQDMPHDPNDTAITQAIVAMAHSLGLRVVAEGVETLDQAHALRQFGCDELQGYYFSRPLPFDELMTFLRTFSLGSHTAVVTSSLSAGSLAA